MHSEPSLRLVSQLHAELIWPVALLNFLCGKGPKTRMSQSALEATAISTFTATTIAIYMLIPTFALGF